MMTQVQIVNEYEKCLNIALDLDLHVGALNSNFVVQTKGGTIIFLNSSVEALRGFLDGLVYQKGL